MRVYADDLAWLKRLQLEVSQKRGKWIPLPDIIRELIAPGREQRPA